MKRTPLLFVQEADSDGNFRSFSHQAFFQPMERSLWGSFTAYFTSSQSFSKFQRIYFITATLKVKGISAKLPFILPSDGADIP